MKFKIAEQNLSALRNKLGSLNAKLARIGTAPVTLQPTGTVDEPHPTQPGVLVRYVEIEVTAPKTEGNGWEFVATLVHTDDGNIIRSVPGYAVPVEFRDKPTWCDHCQCHRQRRDTYIVRHTDGRVMQVGSNCLQEFIGMPAGQLVQAARLLLSAFDICESAQRTNWLGGHNGQTFRLDLDTFLEYVATVTLREGRYITRKLAQFQGIDTTAETALKVMQRGSSIFAVTPEAKALAKAARAYVLAKYSPEFGDLTHADTLEAEAQVMATLVGTNREISDFEHNLLACARAEAIEPRLIGIAAYIVEAYRRAEPVKNGVAQATDLNAGGLAAIFQMFTAAAERGLKRPAIRLADDTGARLHLSPAGLSSTNAGSIYVKQADGAKLYYGKITPQGRFLPAFRCPPQVSEQLVAFAADPKAVAEKYGKLTGCCCFCGRKLTVDKSTDAGYGPTCAERFGLDWQASQPASQAVKL